MLDYPEPTPAMLDNDALFEAIWRAIKGWGISRYNDGLYSGPTGNDARHIYDAVKEIAMPNQQQQTAGAQGRSPTFKDFNPTKDDRVTDIKERTDDLIAAVRKHAEGSPEGQRRMSLAITNYEQAAMWAVKSCFE
jgi:hypothetical protein